jgi:hypothetical protein
MDARHNSENEKELWEPVIVFPYHSVPENPQACLWGEWHPFRLAELDQGLGHLLQVLFELNQNTSGRSRGEKALSPAVKC